MKYSSNLNLIKSPVTNIKQKKSSLKISRLLSDLILIFSVLFIIEESDEIKKGLLNTRINKIQTDLNAGISDLSKNYSENKSKTKSAETIKKSIVSYELKSILILLNYSENKNNSLKHTYKNFTNPSYLKQLQISQMRC